MVGTTYQRTAAASKANAFCWADGQRSIFCGRSFEPNVNGESASEVASRNVREHEERTGAQPRDRDGDLEGQRCARRGVHAAEGDAQEGEGGVSKFELVHGDNRDVMLTLAPASFDAVVCDPPYELGFMDKGWDKSGIAYDERVWKGALRCAKPGAYLLAFGGTRTFHRVMCAIEDAGWEYRDTIMWVYGEGMPKGTDKAKIPEPWRGEWNTALKPAWEPIIVARAPMIGTLARNLQVFGTGAMNIEACRVPVDDANYARNCSGDRGHEGTRSIGSTDATSMRTGGGSAASGRWPANLVHDGSDEVVVLFPSEAGAAAPDRRRSADKFRNTYSAFKGDIDEQGSTFQGDSGSAARFFYCAKASQEDREEGISGTKRLFGMSGAAAAAAARGEHYDNGDGGVNKTTLRHNIHPTVKPTDLMRWLTRLVTPRGGVILDPFVGSGSTGKAAMLEGFRFMGVDLSVEYIEIARARIEFALRQGHQPSLLEPA